MPSVLQIARPRPEPWHPRIPLGGRATRKRASNLLPDMRIGDTFFSIPISEGSRHQPNPR